MDSPIKSENDKNGTFARTSSNKLFSEPGESRPKINMSEEKQNKLPLDAKLLSDARVRFLLR